MKIFIFVALLLMLMPAVIFAGEGHPEAQIDSFAIASSIDDFASIGFFAKGFVQDVSSNSYFRIKYWKYIDDDWSYIGEYQFDAPNLPLTGKYEIEDDYDLLNDLSPNGNGSYRFQIYARAYFNYDYSSYMTATISDTVAPSAPTSLSGSISTDNHPTFSWTSGGELDLIIYNVYRTFDSTPPVTWSYINYVNATDSSSYKDDSITHTPGGQGPNYVRYCVKAVDRNNNRSDYSSAVQIQYNTPKGSENKGLVNTTVGLLPSTTELFANYPNPFNPSTTISFNIPDTKPVKLNIYNIAGQKLIRW